MRFFEKELVVHLDLRFGSHYLETVCFHALLGLEGFDDVINVPNG